MSGDRLADIIERADPLVRACCALNGDVGIGHNITDAIRAALASGVLSPEDLGMVPVEVYVGKPDHTETLYDIPSAPEPGSSSTGHVGAHSWEPKA